MNGQLIAFSAEPRDFIASLPETFGMRLKELLLLNAIQI
jgi:hypothetical protein